MRKTQVALLLDQHEFVRARDEAKDLNLHNPDDATVHGYLARAYMALGNYQDAEASAQWMLNLQPFNVPGLLIAADLRRHYGDPEGALEATESRLRGNLARARRASWPRSPTASQSIEIDMGKVDSASQMLQRADELFPGYPETFKNRARAGAAQQCSESQPLILCRRFLKIAAPVPNRRVSAHAHAGGVLTCAGRAA